MKMLWLSTILKPALTLTAVAVLMAAPGTVAAFQGDTNPKTSDNQSNNKADIDLTAQIRKEIVADKSLSTDAHNVKIISENGVVTLRGDVDSQAERASVLQTARKYAGASNVRDQVTVAPPKNR